MSLMKTVPPRKISNAFYSGDLYYTTKSKLMYNTLVIGEVRGKSNNFAIVEKTEDFCKREVQSLNSNKLNRLPLYTYTDIEYSVSHGSCHPFVAVCNYATDMCRYFFKI